MASNNDVPQTTLLALSEEAPHTTLKPLLALAPQTTDVPQTTELPETFAPQTTEEPQTTDVPQTTDEGSIVLLPFVSETVPSEELKTAVGESAEPIVAGALSVLARAAPRST